MARHELTKSNAIRPNVKCKVPKMQGLTNPLSNFFCKIWISCVISSSSASVISIVVVVVVVVVGRKGVVLSSGFRLLLDVRSRDLATEI